MCQSASPAIYHAGHSPCLRYAGIRICATVSNWRGKTREKTDGRTPHREDTIVTPTLTRTLRSGAGGGGTHVVKRFHMIGIFVPRTEIGCEMS